MQPHDQAPGQLLAVELERFWRQHVCDDHLEAAVMKAARQAAGVLHAQALLRQALGALPRRGGARDHELAHVVHLDNSGASASARDKAGRRALTDRRTARQHQRRSHAQVGHPPSVQ